MDYGFKFPIGSVCRLVGAQPSLPEEEPSWLYDRDECRYVVVERWVIECYGGVQHQYKCRSVTRGGHTLDNYLAFVEIELVECGPFVRKAAKEKGGVK